MSLDVTPISAVADLLNTMVSRIFKDPTQAAAASAEIDKLKESGDIQIALAQIGVNNTEAASTNWFVAGARPFILWVCGLSLCYDVVVYPIAVAFIPAIKPVDITLLLPILMSLIGLRSVEKYHGVDTK